MGEGIWDRINGKKRAEKLRKMEEDAVNPNPQPKKKRRKKKRKKKEEIDYGFGS